MKTSLLEVKKFLLDTGLIKAGDFDRLLTEVGEDEKKLFDRLVSDGYVSKDELRKVKAYVLGVPFVNLKKAKIDKEVLSLIPEPVARKHNIVAFNKNDKELEVAMLDPDDLTAIDFIKKSVGLRILPRLTDTESIKEALLQYQRSLKAEFGDIIKEEVKSLKKIGADEEISESGLKELAEDLPVVRIVDTLLSHAVMQKASDIHIETFEQEVIIRYRIDGILHDAMVLPKEVGPGLTARLKVLSNLRLDEKRLPQDGRFKIKSARGNISFRVSILPTYYGEKIVMRLLPDNSQGLSLEQVGFHHLSLERMQEAIRNKTGLILVTGPTGSGKSTTLYALLELLNTPDVNISTIEDPIEYQMPRINQTQVKPDIGLTFSAGLRSLVRQDPDIIMVGEIRDSETASLAINAALTGHLVLSTLHTNSAAGALPRLVDMGVEPFLLASTVKVVVGQRLVRRLDQSRQKTTLTEQEFKSLSRHIKEDRLKQILIDNEVIENNDNFDWHQLEFYKPKSTGKESDGYSGRIGIQEVLTFSPAIRELILTGASTSSIDEQARKEGMLSMLEDGLVKSAMGVTAIEEVLRVISE
ncbi:MAG: GspE/PulE family protein [Patescibacteria group bacterium]